MLVHTAAFCKKIKLQLVFCFCFHSFMTGLLKFPHLWMHSVPSNSIESIQTSEGSEQCSLSCPENSQESVGQTTLHLIIFQSVVESDTKFLLFAFVTCAITSAGLVFLKIHSGSIDLSIQYKCKHVCLPLVPGNFDILQTAVFLAFHRSICQYLVML